jgi:S-adenosylmethionine decarboxylase
MESVMHLIIDIYTDKNMIDSEPVLESLERAVEVCGAKKVKTVSHSFGDGQGYTAFIMLSESHLAIHTWPERGYVAMDVLMCGDADPYKIIPFVETLFGYSYHIRSVERPR